MGKQKKYPVFGEGYKPRGKKKTFISRLVFKQMEMIQEKLMILQNRKGDNWESKWGKVE